MAAVAEMKKYVLPKDYPELDIEEIDICLIQGGPVAPVHTRLL